MSIVRFIHTLKLSAAQLAHLSFEQAHLLLKRANGALEQVHVEVFFVDPVVESEDIAVNHEPILAGPRLACKETRAVTAVFLMRSPPAKKRGTI